jgi:hypothetical protein
MDTQKETDNVLSLLFLMIFGGGAYLLLYTQSNRRRCIYSGRYETESTSEDGFYIYWQDDKQASYKRGDVSFPFLHFRAPSVALDTMAISRYHYKSFLLNNPRQPLAVLL